MIVVVLEALGLIGPEVAAVLGAIIAARTIIHAWRLIRSSF